MPNSNSKASKASRAKNANEYKLKKLKEGSLYLFQVVLRDVENIEIAKNIKNKPSWLKKALKTLNENGEIK